MNKKVILTLLATTFASHIFADAKSDLLSQMSSSASPQNTNAGLVNNNVAYNNNSSNNFVPQNNAYQQNTNTPPKPKKYKKKTYQKSYSSNNLNKIGDQTFDISYSGDVKTLIEKLKDYDPQLKILSPLGKSSQYNITFDLQAVNLNDIISNITSQTSGGVKVIYNSQADSIRLSYVTKISYAEDATKESLSWRNGDGKPKPILTPDGVVLFPYSQYAAKITCKTQQVCDLRFDKGEHIIDAVMGDTQKWAVQGIVSGAGANQVQHIILKPFYSNLDTNMIVTTDKGRVYNITLNSNDTKYITSAGWYYPQDIQNEITSKFKDLQNQARGFDNNSINNNIQAKSSNNSGNLSSPNGTILNTSGYDDDGLPQLDLDFRYKTSGDDVIWKPTQVFNDGIRTYIKTDPKALFQSAPTFVIVDPDTNQYEIVNYRQKGNYFIVDQVFVKGAMIYNVGRNQQKVEITHITDTSKKNVNILY